MAIDGEIHRLTAEEYHRMIESGGLNEDTRIELIEGLLLDMSPKTPAHERVDHVARSPSCLAASTSIASSSASARRCRSATPSRSRT